MPEPGAHWLAWLASLEQPDQLEGESDDAWTARCARIGREKGRLRQCSIGWHDECSDRQGMGDCECPCHEYDKGRLICALRELEEEVAVLREQASIEAGRCRCGKHRLLAGVAGDVSQINDVSLEGEVTHHSARRCWLETDLKPVPTLGS